MDTNDYDNLFNEFDKLIEYKINELKLNYENIFSQPSKRTKKNKRFSG